MGLRRRLRRAVRSVGRVVSVAAKPVSTVAKSVGNAVGNVVTAGTGAIGKGISSGANTLGVRGAVGKAANTAGHAIQKGGAKTGHAVDRLANLSGDLTTLVGSGDVFDRDARRQFTMNNAKTIGALGQAAPVLAAFNPAIGMALSAASNYALSNAGLQSNKAGLKAFGATGLAAATPMLGKSFSGGLGSYTAGMGAAGGLTGAAGAKLRGTNVARGAFAGAAGGALSGAASDYLAATGQGMTTGELSAANSGAFDKNSLANLNKGYAQNMDWTGHTARGLGAGGGTYAAGRIGGMSNKDALAAGLVAGTGAGIGSYGTQRAGNAVVGGALGGGSRYLAKSALGDENRDFGMDVAGGALGGLGALGGIATAGLQANQRHEQQQQARANYMKQRQQYARPAPRYQQPQYAQYQRPQQGYQQRPQQPQLGTYRSY